MVGISRIGELEEKQKRQKRIGSIVLVCLLLLSTLGFAIGTVVDKGTQNPGQGAHFNGQYWVYSGAGRDYYFSYNPSDINFTNVSFNMNLGDIQNKILYLDNPENSASAIIESNLAGWVGRIQPACFGECEFDLPERNCSEPLIVIRNSESESIRQEEMCVFVNGGEMAINAFLYKILGFN